VIQVETAQVFRAGGRRWFTHKAACRAAARAFIKAEMRSMGEDGMPAVQWMREVALVAAQIAAGEPPSIDWDAAHVRAMDD
jgi:hypothetical protein